MDNTQQAVERIYREQGWRPCEFDEGWHRPNAMACVAYGGTSGTGCNVRRDAATLPDPLADTPEGDHAFMEILRWAGVNGMLNEAFWMRMYERQVVGAVIKEVVILALAEALEAGS